MAPSPPREIWEALGAPKARKLLGDTVPLKGHNTQHSGHMGQNFAN